MRSMAAPRWLPVIEYAHDVQPILALLGAGLAALIILGPLIDLAVRRWVPERWH